MVRWLALLLIPLALAWWPAFDAPYQYDDYTTPLKDPASQSLGAWVQALPHTLRPLTKLSYALESSLGVESAPARRVLNVALFAGSGAWLALIVEGWLGIALAALWLVHPVHAELVIALAGRSVSLSLFLILASVWCLRRERPRAALALALLAVLARETALAWCFGCALLIANARAVLLVPPAAALVLASSRMRALLAFSFGDPDAWNRLGLQWAALPRGTLMLLTQPSAFSVDIEFEPVGIERVLWLVLALAMYVGAGWLAVRGSARVRIAAALWLALVLPLHSVVPKLDPLTARSFSASFAALLMLVACTGRLAHYACVVVGAAALALIPLTRQRAALYRDPVALWRDAAERSRQSTRPWVNLGTLLAQRGRLDEARVALEQALVRNPDGTDVRERLNAVHVLIETRRLLREPQLDETTDR
ncbi:MAG: tetratricopeptide repeat protein [Polyangiales bacterium]